MVVEKSAVTRIAKAVVLTAEIMGTELSAAAAEIFARDLAVWPVVDVERALTRCRHEHSGRLTLAAVVERIDGGHPGPEEAWALCPRSEDDTAVWTDEIAEAYTAASPLLAAGDPVAARMAFREAYGRLAREARSGQRRAAWWPSLGHDPAGRVAAVQRAVAAGRLTSGHAERLLPASTDTAPKQLGEGSDLGDVVKALVVGRAGQ